ncbi:MAG: hypothetical protein ABIP61_00350 [Burkholderiaceae bacterium]
MDPQNLGYAAIQIVHNFGAVSVVGAPLFALWPARLTAAQLRPLAWLVLAAWLAQAASGIGFGAASYTFYGQFPDIHGIAIGALLIKIACAIVGAVLSLGYLVRGGGAAEASRRRVWGALLALGAIALTAAAFLRWFS